MIEFILILVIICLAHANRKAYKKLRQMQSSTDILVKGVMEGLK